MAKHFNKYFGIIAKNLDKRVPKSKKKFSDYLKNQNLTSFLLSPVTPYNYNQSVFYYWAVSYKSKKSPHIPSYKKGDKSECSDYRPISLLSNISKIIEKAMYTRLYNFLEKYNCLYKKQFGFRNSYLTNHALISITEIGESLDNNEYSCGVFLDFQKVFDTVNDNILLKKTTSLWN